MQRVKGSITAAARIQSLVQEFLFALGADIKKKKKGIKSLKVTFLKQIPDHLEVPTINASRRVFNIHLRLEMDKAVIEAFFQGIEA